MRCRAEQPLIRLLREPVTFAQCALVSALQLRCPWVISDPDLSLAQGVLQATLRDPRVPLDLPNGHPSLNARGHRRDVIAELARTSPQHVRELSTAPDVTTNQMFPTHAAAQFLVTRYSPVRRDSQSS